MDGQPRLEVVSTPSCGYGLQATAGIRRGAVVVREKPLVVLTAAAFHEYIHSTEHSAEADANSPWCDSAWWPAPVKASARVVEGFAEREFGRLPERVQRRWMELADSFSMPPAKRPGNIVRSNAYTNGNSGDNYLYETLCRANHSCAPNLSRAFDDDGVAVVTTLRDVVKGDALTISYLSDDKLRKPADERRALLRSTFNFLCRCERCQCQASDILEPMSPPPPMPMPVVMPKPMASDILDLALCLPLEPSQYFLTMPPASSIPRASMAMVQPLELTMDEARSTLTLTSAAVVSTSTAADISDAASGSAVVRSSGLDHGLDAVAALDAAEAALSLQLRACALRLTLPTLELCRQGLVPVAPAPLIQAIEACADALSAMEGARRALLPGSSWVS